MKYTPFYLTTPVMVAIMWKRHLSWPLYNLLLCGWLRKSCVVVILWFLKLWLPHLGTYKFSGNLEARKFYYWQQLTYSEQPRFVFSPHSVLQGFVDCAVFLWHCPESSRMERTFHVDFCCKDAAAPSEDSTRHYGKVGSEAGIQKNGS